jgi:hypothetical protein
MYQKFTGGRWLEILLFTLSSLLLYYTGVGILLFLIPLQLVASRRGIVALLAAAGAFLAGFLGIRFVPLVFSSSASAPDVLVYVEIAVVTLLLVGLVIVNAPIKRRPRTLIMLLGATLVAGIAAVPGIVWLAGNARFQSSLAALFQEVSKMLSGMFATGDAVGGSFFSAILAPSKLEQISIGYLLRSFLVDYLLLLSFSWWAGQASAARTAALFGAPPKFRFAHLRLEGWWLWPLIASGALVLVDLFFGISFWAYIAWNVMLVLLFLYGLQGLAIVRFLFEKHGIPRFLWLLLIVGLGVLAASPRAGIFVIFAVPVFGVSENWIRYRIPRNAEPNEQD